MSLRRCCTVVLLWLAASLGRAHADVQPVPPGQLKFRVFGGSDGLLNLVVTSVAQDHNGFLWIATEDGAYRFDGERFAHFSVEDGLPSSLVLVVAVAPDGGICAGTTRGLACWDGRRFVPVHGLPPQVGIRTMVSYGGRLWVGTDGAGLFVGGSAGFLPAAGWPGDPRGVVRAVWADGDGLVVGNGATVELTAGDGRWHNVGAIGLARDRVEGVLRDREGALWIRSPQHLWLLPRGATAATDLHDGMPTAYDSLNAPTGMTISPRGQVLIATDDGVSYRDHGSWHSIAHSVGMPIATARSVFVDRDDTLWIGAAGLFQLRGHGLLSHYDAGSGLPGEVVWTFQRDPHGALLAGTNRCLARASADGWRCVPGTEGRVVRSVVFPPQGGMFVGGAPSDILYIDDQGKTTSFGDLDRPDHNILAMALGPEGDLWIGTKIGLYRSRGAVPGPLEKVTVPGTEPNARFASLAVVGDQLWTAAAPGGVYMLEHGKWHGFGVADGFRAGSLSYLIARAGGRFCVAYSEAVGVTCFGYDGTRLVDFEHVGTAQGLTTGMVYFLGEDRARRLWIGTGAGVDVMTPTGVDHFDDSDGLAGNDSAAKAFLVDHDGSLWLGATGGASHVLAQYYRGAPTPPATTLVAARLGDHDAHTGLEVGHDENALGVEVAAGTLADGKRVEYQVRLSPLEHAWTTTRQHQARYPVLLPGAYRFEARARIDAGAWGPVYALRFTIRPAWWQTGWFLLAVIALGTAAIAGGVTWRQRAVMTRRTRELHEQSDASFRAVIDRMPDLMSVFRDRKLIYLNQAHRRFLGVERAADVELIERVHPDDRAQVLELFRRVREDGGSDAGEMRIQHADGTWRICEYNGVMVDIAGVPTVVASGRDITERKRMRAKLMVADRMASLGTLAAGIAHEINNPLAYVTGNLEVVAEILGAARRGDAPLDPAELGVAIHDARDGAERVRKIVHGLRSFSRSEDELRAPLALGGVLEAAIRLTANEVRHRAQLVRELGVTPLVIGDDGRLTQVFINLLINAAHAIPEGHSDANRITVRTRTDERGRAVIEIEDTGRGISPDLQSRVFDPFFTTKAVGEGTGLGLSICHGIISGLGGQIAIDSAPGRGTVVRVSLAPAGIAAIEPAVVAIAAHEPAGRRHRVMLVDDEPMVAYTMERLLRRDYDITVATCGRDAIEHVAGGARFDAIVSDVMMPNMTGIELHEELQRVAPDQAARVIFLSGGAFTAQAREQLDALGAPQLEKPVSAKELRAWVSRVASEGTAAAA